MVRCAKINIIEIFHLHYLYLSFDNIEMYIMVIVENMSMLHMVHRSSIANSL